MACTSCKGFNISILIENNLDLISESNGKSIVKRSQFKAYLQPMVGAALSEMTVAIFEDIKKNKDLNTKNISSSVKLADKYVKEAIKALPKYINKQDTKGLILDPNKINSKNAQKQLELHQSIIDNAAPQISSAIKSIERIFYRVVPLIASKAAQDIAAIQVAKAMRLSENINTGQVVIPITKLNEKTLVTESLDSWMSSVSIVGKWLQAGNLPTRGIKDEKILDAAYEIVREESKKYGKGGMPTYLAKTYCIDNKCGTEAGKHIYEKAYEITSLNAKASRALRRSYLKAGDEIGHTILDIIGVLDPFGVADGLNFAWYMGEYNNAKKTQDEQKASIALFGGVVSLIGAAIPYAGDIAKGAKIFKLARKIKNVDTRPAVRLAEKLLEKVPEKAKPFLNNIIELLKDTTKLEAKLGKEASSVGLKASSQVLARQSFSEIVKAIVKSRLPKKGRYLKESFIQSIIYASFVSEEGQAFFKILSGLPVEVAKIMIKATSTTDDLNYLIRELAKHPYFTIDPLTGPTKLSRLRDLLVPFYRKIEREMAKQKPISPDEEVRDEAITMGFTSMQESKQIKLVITDSNNAILNEGKATGLKKLVDDIVIDSFGYKAKRLAKQIRDQLDNLKPGRLKPGSRKAAIEIINDTLIHTDDKLRTLRADLTTLTRAEREAGNKVASIGARNPGQVGKKEGPWADAKRNEELISGRKEGTQDKIDELEQLKKDLNAKKTEIEAEAKPKAKPKEKQKAEPKATATKSKYRRFMDSPLASVILGPELARRHAKMICSIWADETITSFIVSSLFGLGLVGYVRKLTNKIKEEIKIIRTATGAQTGRVWMGALSAFNYNILIGVGCFQGASIDIATETQEVIDLTSLRYSLLTIDETTKLAAIEAGVSTDKISAAMLSTPSDMDIWEQLTIEAYIPFYNGKFGGFAQSMADEMIDVPLAGMRKAVLAFAAKKIDKETYDAIQNFLKPETPVNKTIAIYKEWLSQNEVKDTIEQEKFITCYLIDIISTGFQDMKEKSLKELFKKQPWIENMAKEVNRLTYLYNKYVRWLKDNEDKFADAKTKAEAFKKWFKETFIEVILPAILPDEFIELSKVNCETIRSKYSKQMEDFKNLIKRGAKRAQQRRQGKEEDEAKKKQRKPNRTKPQKKAATEPKEKPVMLNPDAPQDI